MKKGAKESIEIFDNSRDTFVNIPVDEDQDVPEPRDSSISINKLGQRLSQTPFSSAFWIQKDFKSKTVLGPKMF